MAIQGTIDESLEDAAVAVRRQAAFQGYAFAEGESTPTLLVFTKDSSGYSWGSRMAVALSSVSESQTLITITRKESRALHQIRTQSHSHRAGALAVPGGRRRVFGY